MICIQDSIYQAHNLGPPWGDCGTTDLEYYDEYTLSACEMECETKVLYDACNCVDGYMPGSYVEGMLKIHYEIQRCD